MYTELHNILVFEEIGGIAECSNHYTAELSRCIAETGKPIEALTVGELLDIHRDCSKHYNRIMGGAA